MNLEFGSSFLVGSIVVLVAFFYWINRRQDYFKNHGIAFVPSTPLLGSFKEALLGKTAVYDHVVTLYNRPEVKDKPFFGMFLFHKPGLIVSDPELIKRITVKDFSSFSNRYTSSDIHDPLGNSNLFSVKGALWKILRGRLSPFFSSGKLKSMYYLMDKNSSDLVNFMHKKLGKDGQVELEMKSLSSLYSLDVIANCAFGIEANCIENPDGEFRKCGSSIFEMTLWRGLELGAMFMLPQVSKFFGFQGFSDFSTKFIKSTIPRVMDMRMKSGTTRNDLIDTLIEFKRTDVKDDKGNSLTDDMIMGQAAIFFTAGFETSSSTQSFAMYELAKHPKVQEKLRKEIREMLARTDGKVTYEGVMNTTEMPYLHQVIHEILRLYAILPILDRECVNPEGYSLEPFSSFRIPHGMPIYVPYYAIQRDEKNFPEPLKFDPERFSAKNIDKIKPFTNFPFGSGPRNCVGERFGLLQVKTGLVKILKDFRLEPSEKTPETIVLDKRAMLIQSADGLFMKLIKDPLV